MFFERYEIHIQALANVFIEHLSVSDLYPTKIFWEIYTQNKTINLPIKAINSRSKNQKIMEFGVSGLSNNEIGILLDRSEAD